MLFFSAQRGPSRSPRTKSCPPKYLDGYVIGNHSYLGDRRTSLNATASRTLVIFSHDVDHGDRDRCWAFDLFLLRATEHGPSWIGSRRLGCPYLARGPCDPVLACSSINIECNVATFHMEFVQRLAGVKSPFDFVEICQNHSRQKFETLTRAS